MARTTSYGVRVDYLEFTKGYSDKFYCVAWGVRGHDDAVAGMPVIGYGRNGTLGTWRFATSNKEAISKIREKERKGYRYTGAPPLAIQEKIINDLRPHIERGGRTVRGYFWETGTVGASCIVIKMDSGDGPAMPEPKAEPRPTPADWADDW